ncbi:MAG: gliding motility-associated C-terminal domain-containing protein [Bacteroidales bacterium]|nr:gliding motility-associated C-terminal domain-containing protein [Bacteroidales bacterium]
MIKRHKTLLVLSLMWLMATGAALARQPKDTLYAGPAADFVENKGQWEPQVCFKSVTHNATLFAERDAFTFVVSHRTEAEPPMIPHHTHTTHYHAYRMSFEGCAAPMPVGQERLAGYDNYYYGKDRSRWRSHVHHYEQILYQGLYPGIDLLLRSAEQAIEYDFYLQPGADPSQIVMRYEGTDGLRLQKDGSLLVKTSVADLIEFIPHVYQPCDTGRRAIEARYVVSGNEVRLALADYDRALPVVIDPRLYFSTYTGSTADNWGTTATYDSQKNTYSAGVVFGVGYPVSFGAYDETYNGSVDVAIFKFDTTGSQRLYATYLGGSLGDMPHSLFVNDFDELVVYGTTGSDNFPVTPNAFDTTFHGGTGVTYARSIPFPNGSDIFVSRFSKDGDSLMASTYVGGSMNDGINYRQSYNISESFITYGTDSLYHNYSDGARGELIVDDQNSVYVGSTTFSTDFPITAGAIQDSLHGMQEGVVFKLDYNLSNMLWSTYLGGSSDDAVYSIDVDSEYNLLACGGTCSPDFPTTPDAYNTTYNGGSVDAFVSKISYNGDRLMASTFYGSDAYDQSYFVRRGKRSDVFIFGQTEASGSTLIYNANYNVPNSGQFIAHLSPNLDSLVWSTVFGTGNGKPNISPTAFVADICNRVYAVGWGRDYVSHYNSGSPVIRWFCQGTYGMEVTPDAYQPKTDGQDFYIMSLSMDASTLEYATFFGEMTEFSEVACVHTGGTGGRDHVDGGTSRFDRLGTLYQSVCGSCSGTQNFPGISDSSYSSINRSSNCNNAIFRFSIHSDFPLAEFSVVPTGCAPYRVEFNNTGRGTSFEWDFGDGTTSTERDPVHIYAQGGEYTVKLIARLAYGCTEADSTTRTIRVLENTYRNMNTYASCLSGTTFQIGLTPTPGCNYRWTQGSVSDSTIANPYANTAGTYILHITQQDLSISGGCEEVDTFRIIYYSLLDSVAVMPPLCAYDSFGTATAVLNPNAEGTVNYYWDGEPSTSNTYGPVLISERQHSLRVVSDYCEAEQYFTINTPAPTLSKQGDFVLCDGCDGWIELNMDDSRDMPYSYLWHDSATTARRYDLCDGIYTVEIQDSNHCTYYDTTTIRRNDSFHDIAVWADRDTVWEGEPFQLHATEIHAANYEWEPANVLKNRNTADPTATIFSPTLFTLTIRDSAGCLYTDSVAVGCDTVECGKTSVFIPNAFTPNDDGQNDRLCFRASVPISEFYIAIFSRWGELVYESRDVNECWDGRYHETPCLPGVYMYTCRYTCIAGKDHETKGDVTLIR